MARFGRPTARITLTDNERETLQRWARRPSSAQVLALRSRIVLASAEGRTDQDVAAELKVPPSRCRNGGAASLASAWKG
jgi:DNA-binding CsgD family transcriptional regulator